MEVKCEYCGSMIEETLEKCPNCGATNVNVRRTTDITPKTIEELKKWYTDHNLPPYETTRFFIGEDHKGPKAFGIYESEGKYIVYKNKDTGERAIRYQGTDEAYAVNELYMKLKSEILNQKANNLNRGNGGSPKVELFSVREHNSQNGSSPLGKKTYGILAAFITFFGVIGVFAGDYFPTISLALLAAVIVVVIASVIFKKISGGNKEKSKSKLVSKLIIGLVAFIVVFSVLKPYFKPKYYCYDNSVYCQYMGNYYTYDSTYDDYYYLDEYLVPEAVTSGGVDYEYDCSNLSGWNSNITDFYDSNYYENNFADSDSSSSDSSYDWDSGSSWDSDSTDWGSDW